jgi:hypothetical protein
MAQQQTKPDPREQLADDVETFAAAMNRAVEAGVPETEVIGIVMRTLQQALGAAATG